MPKIPSPVYSPNPSASDANVLNDASNTLTNAFTSGATSSAVDKNRSHLIFEVVNVDGSSVDMGSPTVFPYLVMHINPQTFEESFSKLITRQPTRGGFIEFHWGDELGSISASGSTGMFVTIASGLSVLNRKASIAYRKFQDLVSLYKNNGVVSDQRGNPVFRGTLRLYYSGVVYSGYFENLNVSESADKPFTFEVSWAFKVESELRNLGG